MSNRLDEKKKNGDPSRVEANVIRSGRETEETDTLLENRLGRTHTRIRLGIESEKGHQFSSSWIDFSDPGKWYSGYALVRYCLKLSGLYGRGVRNAHNIQVRRNTFALKSLPAAFDGLVLLHLSDIHADMDESITASVADVIKNLDYDLCVMTGDYRERTYGAYDKSLEAMRLITSSIHKPAYGVLGNHDSLRMVPGLEAQGVRMLINESVEIERYNDHITLAGVDDAHYFETDNLEKTIENMPQNSVSILLSHSPELYRHASHANFDVMLSGHTHGGQICLPGGIPITLDSRSPRAVGVAGWRFRDLQGYTSVGCGTSIVNVRLNCLPEVTLHKLVVEV